MQSSSEDLRGLETTSNLIAMPVGQPLSDLQLSAPQILKLGQEQKSRGLLDEAEAIFLRGSELYKRDPWLMQNYARIASARQDWLEATRRFKLVQDSFPGFPNGYIEGGATLIEAGRFDEADAVLQQAVRRFPAELWAHFHYGWSALRNQNPEEALRRWEPGMAAFPNVSAIRASAVSALIKLGRLQEADASLESLCRDFPNEPRLWTDYASVAARRQDLAESLRRWDVARSKFPGNDLITDLWQRSIKELAQQFVPVGPAEAASDNSNLVAKLHRTYRNPNDLVVSEISLQRVLVVGSCLVAALPGIIRAEHKGAEVDYFLVNNVAQLPPAPPHPVESYDFQIVQIPIRSVIPDGAFFRIAYTDVAGFEAFFDECRNRLLQFMAGAMRWCSEFGLITFVYNFSTPQQNPLGRLFPRYDLRNFVYFVERLNEVLANELSSYKTAYLYDHESFLSSYGKKYIRDDAVWQLNHSAVLTDRDFELDQDRLEKPIRSSLLFNLQSYELIKLRLAEIVAMYRTIRQIDMVKLVIIDLDDTLWRGIAAEKTEYSSEMVEGWPLGFIEALLYLKRRGVLLAIVSKNDEQRVLGFWNSVLGKNLISPDDFAVRKIGWRPKPESVHEILGEVNLLPKSVVYIDDNPVERAAIKGAFPEVRVMGSQPTLWRRILLWSAETQVAAISNESVQRTEMVRAQVQREEKRKAMSREDFLASLELQVRILEIDSADHPKFARTLELINKTNQFNTTGRRWTHQELASVLALGQRLFVFEVTDKFTEYGVVGVVIVDGNDIKQMVMSCRVVGLEVETAVVAKIVEVLRRADVTITAAFIQTDANLLCRDLYARCGFDAVEGHWSRKPDAPTVLPPHIKLSLDLAYGS